MIQINGKIYPNGKSVVIRGNSIVIDGKRVEENVSGVVEVKVEGTLATLETDASVSCDDVAGNVTAGGSVNCDNVMGSVQSGGSVNCDDVGGSVQAGGSIRCG